MIDTTVVKQKNLPTFYVAKILTFENSIVMQKILKLSFPSEGFRLGYESRGLHVKRTCSVLL